MKNLSYLVKFQTIRWLSFPNSSFSFVPYNFHDLYWIIQLTISINCSLWNFSIPVQNASTIHEHPQNYFWTVLGVKWDQMRNYGYYGVLQNNPYRAVHGLGSKCGGAKESHTHGTTHCTCETVQKLLCIGHRSFHVIFNVLRKPRTHARTCWAS